MSLFYEQHGESGSRSARTHVSPSRPSPPTFAPPVVRPRTASAASSASTLHLRTPGSRPAWLSRRLRRSWRTNATRHVYTPTVGARRVDDAPHGESPPGVAALLHRAQTRLIGVKEGTIRSSSSDERPELDRDRRERERERERESGDSTLGPVRLAS
jgi:hypothetical protein